MTQFPDSRIIAPPIEEEIYPYRRVWRNLGIQIVILIIIAIVIVFSEQLFGISFDRTLNFIVSLAVTFIPLLLWIVFSRLPENIVLEPRSNLVAVAVVSGLTASAIGIPLVEQFFQINAWLPLESALQRIIGFTLTVGIVDTALKFIVIRYMVWPRRFRIRVDSVAYCVASSIGYSFVVNLHLVNQIQPTYSIAMLYVFSNFTIQVASSMFMAYGFSETHFSNTLPFILPVSIVIPAIVIGITYPLRSGLMNGSLTTTGSSDRPIFSLLFLITVLIASIVVSSFLFSVSERRERESFKGDEARV